MAGWEEVAGEHRRAAARRRSGAGAGTPLPAQAARVGIERCRAQVPRTVEPGLRPGHAGGGLVADTTRCTHGEPDAGELARPVRRAAGGRTPAARPTLAPRRPPRASSVFAPPPRCP